MCRRSSRNPGFSPVLRPIAEFPISKGRQYFLLIGAVFLELCSGCTSSGSGWRAFALNPIQAARSTFRPHRAEISADQRKPQLEAKPAADRDRQLQLVANEEDSNDHTAVDSPTETVITSEATEQKTALPTVDLQNSAGLSLADLESIAMQNNPTLSQALAAVSAEQGVYRQEGLYPNPSIGYLNGTATKANVKQSNGLFYSQEFVTSNKLGLAQQAAAVEIQRYQWDHESQRMRIMNDLKIRYYDVLGAQEALAVTERLVKIAEHSLSMAEKRMEGIHGTKTDLLQARVQLENVRLSHDEAENRLRAAWERMATMAGVSWLKPLHLTEDLTKNIPILDLETCQQQLYCSPQLRSTECDLGHAWAGYRVAQSLAVPNVTVQTVSEYDQATQAATVSTLVALPLPVYNRNQGNIDKSSADIVAAQAEITRVQLVLREQLSDSFHRYKNLQHSERLRDVIMISAEENLRLTEQVFESGEIGFAPVLAAQQSYFQSQLAYVEALTEVHKIATEIQGFQLTGGLNPAAIGSAIQNAPGGGAQRQRVLLTELQDKAAKQLLPAAQISQ
jgi:cobalt-zinc-cadmium efflux system outer membrane protein